MMQIGLRKVPSTEGMAAIQQALANSYLCMDRWCDPEGRVRKPPYIDSPLQRVSMRVVAIDGTILSANQRQCLSHTPDNGCNPDLVDQADPAILPDEFQVAEVLEIQYEHPNFYLSGRCYGKLEVYSHFVGDWRVADLQEVSNPGEVPKVDFGLRRCITGARKEVAFARDRLIDPDLSRGGYTEACTALSHFKSLCSMLKSKGHRKTFRSGWEEVADACFPHTKLAEMCIGLWIPYHTPCSIWGHNRVMIGNWGDTLSPPH